MTAKCDYCKKECSKTINYKKRVFCCSVCVEKYQKNHKPKVCEFC